MSPTGRSLKRPNAKVGTKPKIEIKLRKKRKTTSKITSTLTSLSTSRTSLPSIQHKKPVSSPLKQKKSGFDHLPSILTKQYNTTHSNACNEKQEQEQTGASTSNDYDEDETFSELFDQYIKENDDVHEIILTIQSLTSRNSAAVCQLISKRNSVEVYQDGSTTTYGTNCDYITFILKPMIKHALNSISSNSSSSFNIKSEQIASAHISTGFNMDLQKLETEHKLRLIQLHGLNDETSDDDENIAVFLMDDYVNAVFDAASSPYGTSTNMSQVVENTNDSIDNQLSQNNFAEESQSDSCYENQFVVKLFIDCIYHCGCNGKYVTRTKLLSSLESAWHIHRNRENESTSSFASLLLTKIKNQSQPQLKRAACIKVLQPEKWIERLIHIQLLLPRVTNNSQASCTTSYWYTLPKIGVASKAIVEGRKKMMNKIRRSYNKEIRRSVLENVCDSGGNGKTHSKRSLSNMTGAFHVRDLLARDVVKIVNRPSGAFVRFR